MRRNRARKIGTPEEPGLIVAPLLLGRPAVLLEQLPGLPGRRYLPDLVGDVPQVIQDLEHGILGSPHFRVEQHRQVVAAVFDERAYLEAIVDFPIGRGKTLLYLFAGHARYSPALSAVHLILTTPQRGQRAGVPGSGAKMAQSV
jgi:hypothetical protein